MEFALLGFRLILSPQHFFFSFQFFPLRMGISIIWLSYHYVLETDDWFHRSTDRNFVPEWIILREISPTFDLEDKIWDTLSSSYLYEI